MTPILSINTVCLTDDKHRTNLVNNLTDTYIYICHNPPLGNLTASPNDCEDGLPVPPQLLLLGCGVHSPAVHGIPHEFGTCLTFNIQ